jgi:NTP pyrophosphatase (non-canonical NTP hydrolase)
MSLSLPLMGRERSDSEYRSELLIIVMEECAEVQQACSKVLRYGDQKNINDLISEVGDLQCMIQLLASNLDISEQEMYKAIHNKRKKLVKWSNLNVY